MKSLQFFFLIFPAILFAQNQIVKSDFDGDKIMDKVYFDSASGMVICQLSSQKFKKVKTKSYNDDGTLTLGKTKNGFEISVSQMRAGNSYQFRYEKESKKMRLIGMWRSEFGPANNDGSGESSVNLLTNNYIADWNYYDVKKSKLVKMPSIKKKMIFPKIYFDDLDDVFYKYMDQDVKYYEAEKKRLYHD
ncbi:hypothetical protein IV494_02130 [Kaistella sp. G5-32]|uniref:Uncharacterized protein n=1 Tax=Kaistella gelatinilytica TaxID=2787636 RepID=A0ABS0F8D4_9FLAO|nr:hypothetical protein [Kaistella gelatinilytica]MBF8455966.1 hypothetical protein [Kaistella gelatinilytica]